MLSLDYLDETAASSLSYLAKMGIVDRNSALYRNKCASASFYPFSIVTLTQRIELIATNLRTLEIWAIGLSYVQENKKLLGKVSEQINKIKF